MSAKHGYGTKMKIGGRNGTSVVNCRTIGGPKFSTAVIDAGAHDSPSATTEKVPGLKDAGQVQFEILYDPTVTTHSELAGGLWKLWNDRTVGLLAVEYPTTPSAKGFEFNGFVVGFEPSAPFDDLLTASVTIEVTGAVTAY